MAENPRGQLDIGTLSRQLIANVEKVVVGKRQQIIKVLVAWYCEGHVLLEDVPGVAKTILARAFARTVGCTFKRIQCTPDLLPTDVTGTQILDRQSSQFVMRKGPIFCQMLLADELNRAPARTQSALLEAMQEKQVTIEGTTLVLPTPFMVLATQNPIEQEGVYRLPEAQLDRFLFRIDVAYPARDQEIRMLALHSHPPVTPSPVTDADELVRIQERLDAVYSADELHGYIIDLVRRSREHPQLLLGASPRAAIFILKASRARALLQGRGFVTHEDIQETLFPVLGHRLILRPEAEMEGRQVRDIVLEVIRSVPVLKD